MPELNGEMFKRFFVAFIMFIMFAFSLGVFYEIVSTSVVNALTGNWQYDMLIYIIPLAFASGVIMIIYNKYVPKDRGD